MNGVVFERNERSRSKRLRRIAASVGILAALVAVPIAIAQTKGPSGGPTTPVIDAAPTRPVPFRSTVTVAGHLDGFEPGDVVVLERLDPDGTWRAVAAHTVDNQGRVLLTAERVRVSSPYRLHWADHSEQDEAFSEERRIEVEPLLRFRARPDDVYRGHAVRITGELYPKVVRDRRVIMQQWYEGEWHYLARVPVTDGRFRYSFTPQTRGHRTVRALFIGGELNSRSVVARPIRIYDNELATWYGPGFYGNSTACGQRLDYGTLGVAHRTLPCGTKVSVFYQGRSITVTVIDRGPYTSASWDLTGETARRLGFSGKGLVGVAY